MLDGKINKIEEISYDARVKVINAIIIQYWLL